MSNYKYTVVEQYNDGLTAYEKELETFTDVDEALDYADERNQQNKDHLWFAVEVSR